MQVKYFLYLQLHKFVYKEGRPRYVEQITSLYTRNYISEFMTSIRSLLRGEKDIDEMLYEVQLDKISIIKGKLRPSGMY